MYDIRNVSKKDLSKIIREFEKSEKLTYEKNRPKHKPTDSYFYPARQLAKCMIIAVTFNWHDYGGYTVMTAPSLNVYSMDEDESKLIIVHNTLSQNYSEDVDKKCSTEMEKSEYTITEQKYEGYKESTVTKEVPSYLNIFECGRNILGRLDVTYERACMATQKYKYYNTLLNTLIDDNNLKGVPFNNDKLRKAVGKVMEETEA